MKRAIWDEGSITAFWDYIAERTDLHDEFFSYVWGRGILRLLDTAGLLSGDVRVLDYGCGPGFLAERLLERNISCVGVDSSPDTVALVNERLQRYARWEGAVVGSASLPDSTFDVLLCVETVEHLLDGQLSEVLDDIRRLLRPGGVVLITTPNEEDLGRGEIGCPFCGLTYHRVQHMRAFSAATLRTVLESAGFEVSMAAPLDFANLQYVRPRAWDIGMATALRQVRRRCSIWLDALQGRRGFQSRQWRWLGVPGRHLVALAKLGD